MKAKVYQYGAYPRDNQIVSHKIEIEQLDGGVYFYLVEVYKSNSDLDLLSIIANIGDSFFEIDQCSRQSITRPENLELIKKVIADYPSHVMIKIENNQHVSIMDMKIFETMGKDTAPLVDHRLKLKKERIARYQEQKRQAEEKKRLAEIKENKYQERK